MNVEMTHCLDPLVTADHVDSSWLCRAARALDDLDRCLETVSTDVPVTTHEEAPAARRGPRLARAAAQMSADVQRLHDRARSLRRRLVLATKDARLGPDLRAELAALSRDADEFFGCISLVLQESVSGAGAADRGGATVDPAAQQGSPSGFRERGGSDQGWGPREAEGQSEADRPSDGRHPGAAAGREDLHRRRQHGVGRPGRGTPNQRRRCDCREPGGRLPGVIASSSVGGTPRFVCNPASTRPDMRGGRISRSGPHDEKHGPTRR